MGTIFRDKDGNGIGAAGRMFEDVCCIFCPQDGEHRADAYWLGSGKIGVCFYHATTILPRMIADAIVAKEHGDRRRVLHWWTDRVEPEFWKGFALALMREPEKEQKELEMKETVDGFVLAGFAAQENGQEDEEES
jgi:hypothetical protein